MRHNVARWFTLIAAMFALSFVAGSAFAQDDDPPNRAARLSYASGSVSFEPAGTDDWVDAIVNRPMTTGDKLWADQDGRVEVRIDSYALRLGPQTGFSFLNLDDNVVQVRLTEGSLNIRVRRLDENQTLEIDTPNLAFNVLRPGSYRIDVNENGDATLVTVRDGQGEVTGGGSAYPIRAGDSVNFSGVDELNADVEGIGGGDDFDQWSESRDQRWEHSTSAQYVSDDAVGYEDLDENGQWNSDPDYGTVWYPRNVAADWAPYRYGHWVWVSPWGWTWVDDASWGFAPFHYGRWVVARGRWGWVPSPPRPAYVTREYVRPVYAPALVAWVGGPRGGVRSLGVGVAWFPLGPRDVYTPSYHVSERYVERVNVSNTRIVNRTQVTNVYNTVYVNKTVNVTNITYQNQRANNSVTATSQASFTTAQPVGRNQVRVDARQMAAAPVTPLASVAPQQRSFAGAGGAAKAHPPANFASRNVVAKTAPPPAPVPVAQQMKAVQANGGRPVAAAQVRANQPEPARANVKVAAPAKVAALPPKGNSVNRPGQPVRPAQANQQNQPAMAQPNANRPANVNPNPPNAANRPNPGSRTRARRTLQIRMRRMPMRTGLIRTSRTRIRRMPTGRTRRVRRIRIGLLRISRMRIRMHQTPIGRTQRIQIDLIQIRRLRIRQMPIGPMPIRTRRMRRIRIGLLQISRMRIRMHQTPIGRTQRIQIDLIQIRRLRIHQMPIDPMPIRTRRMRRIRIGRTQIVRRPRLQIIRMRTIRIRIVQRITARPPMIARPPRDRTPSRKRNGNNSKSARMRTSNVPSSSKDWNNREPTNKNAKMFSGNNNSSNKKRLRNHNQKNNSRRQERLRNHSQRNSSSRRRRTTKTIRTIKTKTRRIVRLRVNARGLESA